MSSPATLQALIGAWVERGDDPAVVALRDSEAEAWSYERLVRTAQRLGGGLLRAGLSRAEPVALLGPASPEWLACFFGVIVAGGIAVPLDVQLPEEEAMSLLLDSRCRRLFTTRSRRERLVATHTLAGLQLFLLDGDAGGEAPSWKALLTPSPAPLPTIEAEAIAILLYTSGTTGVPKGVPLSHANILANVAALEAEALAGPDDRVLLPLPLHHAYPVTVGVFAVLSYGSSLLLPADVSGPALARALGEATVLIGVPRLYSALLEAVDARLGTWQRHLFGLCLRARRQLGWPIGRVLLAPLRRRVAPNLRLVASGGAKLDEAVEWALLAIGWQVLTGYGLTETAPILTFNLPGRSRVGSAGRPLPGVGLRIAQPDGNGVGEIQAKGHNVFRDYWHRPELTGKAFTDDGWFRTGDLGWLDDGGYLHIASRSTERIVLPNGEKVLPEAVEAVYEESPIVREAAVLEQDGQLAVLVVPNEDALRAGGSVQIEGQLRDELERLGRRLRPYQRAARIAVTREKLPRTPIGKLQRFRLPALWQSAAMRRKGVPPAALSQSDRNLLADPTAAAVWEWLQERFPDGITGLDASPQLDLGVDSLAWLGLTLDIEQRFGRSLGEEAVGRIVTLRDLLREVVAASPVAPAVVPAPAAGPSGPRRPVLGLLLHLLNRVCMALLFRTRAEGLEHLPASGAFLLVPSHVSYLDPLALAAALPFRRLPGVHWAGWTELLFATPLRRLACQACNIFPIDPKRGGLAAIAAAEALLRQDRVVVWFPEGRRAPDGRLQGFTPGIGLLIARTGVPAVPVRIRGSYEAWPCWRRLPRCHRITVTFGPPVEHVDLEPAGGYEAMHREIAARLREAVAAL